MRLLGFLYGLGAYALFQVTCLYAAGFIANVGVPKSIDSPRPGSFLQALTVDTLLLAVFVLQHSGMARPAFKRRWTRLVPPHLERSTYVVFSCLALIALFAFWQPLGGPLWRLTGPAAAVATGIGVGGWLVVLSSTFMINHFDLFGLRQVWLNLRGLPYTPLPFKLKGAYNYVRHPLYVGWLMAFWGTATMTVTHLFFAVMTTAYILKAIGWEERDLMDVHPEYEHYRRRVPSLVPTLGGAAARRVVPGPSLVRVSGEYSREATAS